MSSDQNPAKVGRVTFELRNSIAILTIDNPPVNASSHTVRQGLVNGIDQAINQQATGAVIIGAGRCFVAGADLREFGQPLQSPELPDVIRVLENAPFPIIAALHGVALGGGLELSLGCDYRIAAKGTMVGLPEVSLGFVPGAGGTQRLPRLVGVSRAIDLICAATRIPAEKALKIGLIDALADHDLLESALAFLRKSDRPKRLTINLSPPTEPAAKIEASTVKALKRSKGQANVSEAIHLIKSATNTPPEAALADERAVFQKLRVSNEAFALRYLFFAERRAGAVEGINIKQARAVTNVGIIGGGTMGQGIAHAVLAAGLPVTLVERDDDALKITLRKMTDALEKQQERGRLTSDAAAARLERLTGGTDLKTVSDCDLVIEAVFEDMEIKTNLIKELETILPPEAIIATNTSYLDIDEMSAALAHPERVLGLHFFSPANIMKLLEVVRTEKTSDATLATGLKLARTLGKQPVVSRVAEGFIGNRIYAAYRRRAELLVLDGTPPEAIDAAITEFGFAMGPFAVADMSGLDIAWAMRKRLAKTRNPKARYVKIPDMLCEAGRLGRKTNAGWYDYSTGKMQPDPKVEAIINQARTEAGITSVSCDTNTIQRQLMAAIVNEAACLLDEGIAQRPSDVDVVLASGYGFPRWRGGPLYWASRQEAKKLDNDIAILSDAIGHGFKTGPIARVLNQLKSQEN